jgi:hypothetical protein
MTETTASAVSFAASLRREGNKPHEAMRIAARYYKVDYTDVQKGMASRAGKSNAGKKRVVLAKPCNFAGCVGLSAWKFVGEWAYADADWAKFQGFTCAAHGKTLPPLAQEHVELSIKWTKYSPTKAPGVGR